MRFNYEGDRAKLLEDVTLKMGVMLGPLLPIGQGELLAKKVGVVSATISIARRCGRIGKVKLRLDTILKICGAVPGAPRLTVEAGDFIWDATGCNPDSLYARIRMRLKEMQDRNECSLIRIEALTGIHRAILSKIKREIRPSITMPTILSLLEAFEGDVTLELHEPTVPRRITAKSELTESEDPYSQMVESIRQGCVRNIGFYSLDMTKVAENAELDKDTFMAFIKGTATRISLSRIFDIAKACQCEINLTVR